MFTIKPSTEIELRFIGPDNRKKDAINALHKLGFIAHKKKPQGVSWRDHFPELDEHEIGTYLSGARHREGLTQKQLSEKSGVPQRHISEMENGKRPIGKKTARIFAGVLNTDYHNFIVITQKET